jgi:type II secretory pathway pseudopilin PulG
MRRHFSARGASRSLGFTLLEILIATAILVIGVTGIVALFPTSIENAGRTVEDTYASAIGQSVVTALSMAQRDGLIYQTGSYTESSAGQTITTPRRYLLLNHDGLVSTVSTQPEDPTTFYRGYYTADFMILLPHGPAGNTDPTLEPRLLYPYLDGTYGNRAVGQLSSGTPNDVVSSGTGSTIKPTASGSNVIWVQKVAPVGRDASGNVRFEYLDANGMVKDSYPQYSWALTLERARDTTGTYSDYLFQAVVMVFRNFDPGANTAISNGGPIPKTNVPVREFSSLVSLGPGGPANGVVTSANVYKPFGITLGSAGLNGTSAPTGVATDIKVNFNPPAR